MRWQGTYWGSVMPVTQHLGSEGDGAQVQYEATLAYSGAVAGVTIEELAGRTSSWSSVSYVLDLGFVHPHHAAHACLLWERRAPRLPCPLQNIIATAARPHLPPHTRGLYISLTASLTTSICISCMSGCVPCCHSTKEVSATAFEDLNEAHSRRLGNE
jgi:hypothetical protein